MSKHLFRFKQFSVAQERCAMKVGTDGFLLGALSPATGERILDIGTGTGLVALMLAQRNTTATIEALEIDPAAAEQAAENFSASAWTDRLKLIPLAFEAFETEKQYDLIVSNPPYFIQAYTSPDTQRNTARHAATFFLGDWLMKMSHLLSPSGKISLILPADGIELVIEQAAVSGLNLQSRINIHSFANQEAKRIILVFGKETQPRNEQRFVIYEALNQYTQDYAVVAKPFFLHF